MSHLVVITHPSLVPGFHLAGVEAYGAEDVETAQGLISSWIEEGNKALVAIDENLLSLMDPDMLKRMESSQILFHIGIPGGHTVGSLGYKEINEGISRQQRITEMVRRAIGVHIMFDGKHNG